MPRRKSTIDWDAFGLFLDTRLRFLAWLPLKVSNLLLPIDIKACECEPNSRGKESLSAKGKMLCCLLVIMPLSPFRPSYVDGMIVFDTFAVKNSHIHISPFVPSSLDEV